MRDMEFQGTLRATNYHFSVPASVFLEDLTIYEQSVYFVLLAHASFEGTSFPSIRRIAQFGRMSERKAQYCIRSLVDKGLLQVNQRFEATKTGEMRQTSNEYTIVTPQPRSHQGQDEHASAQHAPRGVHTVHRGVHSMHRGGAHGAPQEHDHFEHNQVNNTSSSGDSLEIHVGNEEPRSSASTPPPISAVFASDVEEACQAVEIRMIQHTGKRFIVKREDYKALKQLLASGIPLDFILTGIDRAFERNPDISTFRYCAKVITDLWGKELAKRESVAPIDFPHAKRTRAASDNPGRYIPEGLAPEVAAALEEGEMAHVAW